MERSLDFLVEVPGHLEVAEPLAPLAAPAAQGASTVPAGSLSAGPAVMGPAAVGGRTRGVEVMTAQGSGRH
ncbi:hypothetical protein [Streptomyces naphthomycinicus]|uniref:hypothetical protein n=1 Tax=Streptomyces naphthomycinicus TaxID=2872625 RepID=UPI001CEC6EA1|nr:hypothetical protein [Streptomyces sp. TML10]